MKCVPEEQRGDATILTWQPNPVEVAGDEAVTMVRVGCEEQSVVPGVGPRECRVCRYYIHKCEKGQEPCRVAILIRSSGRCGGRESS